MLNMATQFPPLALPAGYCSPNDVPGRIPTWSLSLPDNQARIDLGETLSIYPFNYELAAFQKYGKADGLLSQKGKDNGKFWTSTLMFSCPLPEPLLESFQKTSSSSSLLLIVVL
jgi:hypothetical protein